MHDIKYIRNHPEQFDRHLSRRGVNDVSSSEILSLDKEHRHNLQELQDAQQLKNDIAQNIGKLKASGGDSSQEISELMKKATEVREKIEFFSNSCSNLQTKIQEILSYIPNILEDDVPDGKDETNNLQKRLWGNIKTFDFDPKPHYEIGEALGMMDFETASKVAGSRFVFLNRDLAKLERALANFMLDNHTTHYGYTEFISPMLVNSDSVFGVGQLPKFADDMFKTTDDRWLISTAEVSLSNIVRDKIIESEKLPLRLTAYTPCFRSEAGSAGKDTRGMIRMHQFSKVEMVSIVKPEDSKNEHERMTSIAEELLKKLELPYRVMCLCSGDTGFASQKTYDIEVWLPSYKNYREISSCSNCGSFQARRMNARFKTIEDGKKKIDYLHTLNGSGLPIGRTIVAILENYQQSDGCVVIPDVLRKYMGDTKEIKSNVSL